MILNKGEKSPYDGILIPEYHYREMQSDIWKMDAYQEEVKMCMERTCTQELQSNSFPWFMGGVVMGIIAALLVPKGGL